MTIVYILLAILLLGILITVHEFGHFAAARLCGIEVKEFSMGFGPVLLQKTDKRGTVFSLRPIPLGGYCMFYGDNDGDPTGVKQDDPRCYDKAPVWKRMLTVVAGPLMNFVLAFLVAVILTACFAQAPMGDCYIYDVTQGSPAMEAGLRPGDAIISIDGENVQKLNAQEVVARIGSGGEDKPVNFVIFRDGQEIPVSVSLRYDEAEGRSIIGVMISETYGKISAGRIVPEAWNMCTYYGGAIVRALGALITTGEGLQDSAGPIGIVQMVSEQTRQYGVLAYLELLVFISINLGLMNLLPIPGLDGSRLVFHLIEAVIGKPVNRKVETIIYLIGYAFLIGVMIFFTFKDVMRLFGK